MKKKIFSMLVLLMTAVTGAWATEKSINDIAVDDIIKHGDVITNTDYIQISYDGHIIALGNWSDASGTVTVTRGSIVNDNCVENAAGEYFLFNDSQTGLQGWYSIGKTLYGIPYNESGLKVTGKTWDSEWEFYTLTVELAPAPAVTLTDGNDLSGRSAYAGQTVDVTYTREFTSGKTSTVCLPFAYTKKEGDGSFYAFTNIEKEGSEYVATMTEPAATTLTANTPYLYMPIATGNVDFGGAYTIPTTLTAGSTTSNGWTFKGTYTGEQWESAPTGIYGFSAQSADGISQGQFVKVGDYVKIKPMRCYLENESFAGARGTNRAAEQLPETIKVRLISANGEVTGIGTISTKTGEGTIDNGAWYSLDGRRIEGKPSTKGVYINNGNKVIIK